VPPGNGHVVLAIPGFFRHDRTTRQLPAYLDQCGVLRAVAMRLGSVLKPA